MRRGQRWSLDKTLFAEAVKAARVAADDKMIVDHDVEDFGRLLDLVSQFDVGIRRPRHTGRVVVDQDDRTGTDKQGVTDDLAGIDDCLINRARDRLEADKLILSVEVKGQKPFDVSVAEGSDKIKKTFSVVEMLTLVREIGLFYP